MTVVTQTPSFCEGIQYFGEALPGFEKLGKEPAIAQGQNAIADPMTPMPYFKLCWRLTPYAT
jgi:hypothetical protein